MKAGVDGYWSQISYWTIDVPPLPTFTPVPTNTVIPSENPANTVAPTKESISTTIPTIPSVESHTGQPTFTGFALLATIIGGGY